MSKISWGIIASLLFFPAVAMAQRSIIDCQGVKCNSWQNLVNTANNLIVFLFRIAIALASVSFAYAGFLYVTAAGDEGKIKQAHGIFGKVLTGFVVMLVAWLLVKLILRLAGGEYSLLQ